MPLEMKLPELGENVEKGDVVRVLVSAGDDVAKDQAVLELETDKATIEVPSSVAGKVTDVKVKAGDKVKVGQVVLLFEEGAGAPAGDKPAKDAPEKKEPPDDAPPKGDPAPPAADRKDPPPAEPPAGDPPKPRTADVVDITSGRAAAPHREPEPGQPRQRSARKLRQHQTKRRQDARRHPRRALHLYRSETRSASASNSHCCFQLKRRRDPSPGTQAGRSRSPGPSYRRRGPPPPRRGPPPPPGRGPDSVLWRNTTRPFSRS
jgi:pyruvate/2-oxoglutarate dehydrogenase complex dihydrolipoamide acyltransferase (E2) component